MCGIVAGIDQVDIKNNLINSINYLEYRGYDSAGITLNNSEHEFSTFKLVGKVRDLKNTISHEKDHFIGIAHTRWATHGKVCIANTHPHISNNRIAIVHNGIIENFSSLKSELVEMGYKHNSETDSEVIATLINYYFDQGLDLSSAFKKAISRLKGSFAIAAIDSQDDKHIYIATQDSPLVLGLCKSGNYVASDQIALLELTNKFIYLNNKTLGVITQKTINLEDFNGNKIEPKIVTTDIKLPNISLGSHKHYMHKEIHQQAQIAANINASWDMDKFDLKDLQPKIKNIKIIACGSSYNAGCVAKYWFEEHCQIPTQVEIASEYRYHNYINTEGDLLIFISQSGETADTLAALRESKSRPHLATLAICNEPHSAIVRESDIFLDVMAGKEIGVASTKAFTAQLITLLHLCFALKGEYYEDTLLRIKNLPNEINSVLQQEQEIALLAKKIFQADNIIFLGRNINFPIAAEGALKLKEISYINANSYPAGELKHGPLALVDPSVFLVYLLPSDKILEKNLSNMSEIEARGGNIITISDQYYGKEGKSNQHALMLSSSSSITFPIVSNIAQQLLAYYVATYKGHDVDQPRNLAKAVTVE